MTILETYITLLRGINVGGQKKVKMAELRLIHEELKFINVQTYIQSGNIIFDYTSAKIKQLEILIENKILEKYEFKVPTIVIEARDFEQALRKNPFLKNPTLDKSRLYFTFLSDSPSASDIEKLQIIETNPEEYYLDGKTFYLHSPMGYGRAKLNNNFIEKILNVSATTRNWKTVNKLVTLAKKGRLNRKSSVK